MSLARQQVVPAFPLSNSSYCAEHLPDADAYAVEIQDFLLSQTVHTDLLLQGITLKDLNLEKHQFIDCDFDTARFIRCSFAASLSRALYLSERPLRGVPLLGLRRQVLDFRRSLLSGLRFFRFRHTPHQFQRNPW